MLALKLRNDFTQFSYYSPLEDVQHDLKRVCLKEHVFNIHFLCLGKLGKGFTRENAITNNAAAGIQFY